MNEQECVVCHKKFKCYGQLRYCSDKCRIAGYRTSRGIVMDKVTTKTCIICGKEFQTTYPQKKYCSEDCVYQANLAHKRKKYAEDHQDRKEPQGHDMECVICGKQFKARSVLSKYCTAECRKKATQKVEHEYYLRRKAAEKEGTPKPKEKKKTPPEVLDKTAKRAKAKGLSYGQYKAQEYEVKVEFPWRQNT